MNNKKVFTVKDEQDNELELAVLRSSPKTQVEAQLVYSKAWREAESQGAILRRDIDEIATKRGLWNDEKRLQVEELEKKVLELEKNLRGGANSFTTVDEAKQAALQMRKLRNERAALIRPRLELDSVSCENFADIARTNYIISQTVVNNGDGKKYFSNMDDFISQSNGKVALAAAVAYYEFNIADQKSEVYEDEFLKKYKFIDSEGKLIDSQGRLITEDNKLIDKEGRYINESGEFVDVNGIPVDSDGNYKIDFKEWD